MVHTHTHTKEKQDTNELENLKTRWFKINFFLKKNECLLKTMPVSQYDICHMIGAAILILSIRNIGYNRSVAICM